MLLACGLLVSPVVAHAYSDPKMVVTTNAGESYEFFISDNPSIKYQDNLLVCMNAKGLSVSVEAANVKTFKFYSSDDITGIGQVELPNVFGSKLSGLEAGSRVDIVTLDAKVVKNLKANTDGTVDINLGELPNGVFIIKTQKGSFKIKH